MVEDWRREDKEVGGRKGKTGRRTDRHLSPHFTLSLPSTVCLLSTCLFSTCLPLTASPPPASPPPAFPPTASPLPASLPPASLPPSLHLPPSHLPSGDPQYRYFCLESGRRTLKFLITG
ncbi:hypothetical protein Pcinc_041459 [Petrolisthes cinctipes]|uniref:Uncharacterized protein n=1 Tax=Petrolisthes cinctipes TaxID=88211 RepID=A0AAE1EGX0_PETCI|nr:hypothetical protein Pcinc_041459 [Petrolisthes cinctipes]